MYSVESCQIYHQYTFKSFEIYHQYPFESFKILMLNLNNLKQIIP